MLRGRARSGGEEEGDDDVAVAVVSGCKLRFEEASEHGHAREEVLKDAGAADVVAGGVDRQGDREARAMVRWLVGWRKR